MLDPFCGSGMTGVAAALSGRRAILNDLSPAAIHLAWNHTHPCDPDALMQAFDLFGKQFGRCFEELYSTKTSRRCNWLIHWTIWSTRHACPKCKQQFLSGARSITRQDESGHRQLVPLCSAEITRKD